MEVVGGISEIPPMSSTVVFIPDLSEFERNNSDRTSVRCGGGALLRGSAEPFRSTPGHSVELAEFISGTCEIPIENRLCPVDSPELGKTNYGRTSVCRGGRALPGGVVELFCSTPEYSVGPPELISAKSGIRVGFRLCPVDTSESGKTWSDRTPLWWDGRALLGEPIDAIHSTPENSDRRPEFIWSEIGRVLS